MPAGNVVRETEREVGRERRRPGTGVERENLVYAAEDGEGLSLPFGMLNWCSERRCCDCPGGGNKD